MMSCNERVVAYYTKYPYYFFICIRRCTVWQDLRYREIFIMAPVLSMS